MYPIDPHFQNVLDDPNASVWLKNALTGLLGHNPHEMVVQAAELLKIVATAPQAVEQVMRRSR